MPTTIGHGIHSQYKSAHAKEWIARENRKASRTDGGAFDDSNSFHRSSLYEPIDSAPIEHQHQAMSKSLAELRALQAPVGGHTHTCRMDVPPTKAIQQPALKPGATYMPHHTHKHHFGWNPPTPATDVGSCKFNAARKYGDAEIFQNKVGCNLSLISSRKP